MKDRDWQLPSLALTLVSGLVAIALIPSYSGILPALRILPLWMLASAILGGMYGFLAMAVAGVRDPLARIREAATHDWRRAALLVACVFLAGVNMTTFMWTKPLLNYLVPFWADPLLADIDRALFLGHDPWTLLTSLNSGPMAIFYHRGWFAMMVVTLIAVLSAPPSPEKSALMLTYFVLWSVVGPVIHSLLPAAGPIFFADMGYGDRFAGLHNVSETRAAATYLWTIYAHEGFGPGSGISAMPSLHIATTTWMLIAIRRFAPWLTVPMLFAAILIFLLSIALGWHYAIDGIVGGALSIGCYLGFRAVYGSRAGGWRPVAAWPRRGTT